MELSEAIFNLVHSVRNNIKHELNQLDSGLSPMHFKSLKVISMIDDCTGQKLADFMGRDKAQINRLVKELVNQELITKEENKNDKRSQFLVLSTKALELMRMFKNSEKHVFNKMIVGIPPEQIEHFIELTKKLKNNLD
ncbi:MarR family winged helix-turn-helix transcriptional regulator [Psychrosphaera sp. B3R10]|uniref:Helix-turn-helix domain-containing protein n=1 Tax=Psychrosphaera algicola TaxID=3023714 RepID=A0ABT5FDP1_9GAMM|nr:MULTISPECIES: helix-turn-helix domain-containing protein [unclassified Psychrosphaera]MBU2880425.1 MarR family winged helix-turn-helix transcriptional regulator [Psychrosphaera sp. I2R16]MBU2987864.1 MarR family winged helix-turn-helix transcriptional regulator [Psychrosphaera sp. B3R10]MDC2889234.1 helix-turn-helix domain-containing protein [Psychrosphaera sp. G1-22]MDO6720625.1 helix-turn-helix domain-containing protein [Psychrosphaera sp. 1_MG-2023]